MNYLAHAWLSFNDDAILTGNMISDFVKANGSMITLFKYNMAFDYIGLSILLPILMKPPAN
jgi:hypothetical protein